MFRKPPHILIVEARFYTGIADALLEGAAHHLDEAGATFDVETVPGALEIPGAIAMHAAAGAASTGKAYDGFVALGCVIKGETTHYEIVCAESARGLMELSIRDRLAIGNGILTCLSEEQAWARARRSDLDKGGGAAAAALAMVSLKRRVGQA